MSKQSINQAISEAKISNNIETVFGKTDVQTYNNMQSVSKLDNVDEQQSNNHIFTIEQSNCSAVKFLELGKKEVKFTESPT